MLWGQTWSSAGLWGGPGSFGGPARPHGHRWIPVQSLLSSGPSRHSWALSSPALQGQGSPQVTGERSFLPEWQAARSSCKTPNRFLKKKKKEKERNSLSQQRAVGSASSPSPGTGTGLPRCVRAPLRTLPLRELCTELDSSLFLFFQPISAVGAGQPPLLALCGATGTRGFRAPPSRSCYRWKSQVC